MDIGGVKMASVKADVKTVLAESYLVMNSSNLELVRLRLDQ